MDQCCHLTRSISYEPQPGNSLHVVSQELTVVGDNTLKFADVLVGDVWLCSGQSNMAFGLGGCDAEADIKTADAVIDRDTVVVSSSEVGKPVAVRYAFQNNPAGCNLYNKEGLPASPFRTDKW